MMEMCRKGLHRGNPLLRQTQLVHQGVVYGVDATDIQILQSLATMSEQVNQTRSAELEAKLYPQILDATVGSLCFAQSC